MLPSLLKLVMQQQSQLLRVCQVKTKNSKIECDFGKEIYSMRRRGNKRQGDGIMLDEWDNNRSQYV